MVDEFNSKHGQTVALPFSKANMTTGEANTDLPAGPGGGTLHVMPKAGSVLGVTIMSNAAITAGTITARAHSSSTEIATTGYPVAVASSAAQGSYALARPRAIRFAAGDKLGISVTTTTTLDPTDTLDVDGLLLVQFDPD